ncbi:MAG: universal stress protein [Bacteriovoracaceae bacterium]|jgi:hypothetical protein|nr:universal stress protein [Bacteriovoracaceae bacterium]
MCHHYKNIVIEVSMRGATRDHLKSVFDNALLESAENIYLINYFNESFRKYLPVNLQGEKDLTVIRDFIAKDLDNLRDEITANHNVDIKIIKNECLLGNDCNITAIEHLEKVDADLVIVATRGEQGAKGLFKESFSFFLTESAPCDVLVLRPVH